MSLPNILLIDAESHVTDVQYLCRVLAGVAQVHLAAKRQVGQELQQLYVGEVTCYDAGEGLDQLQEVVAASGVTFVHVIVVTAGVAQRPILDYLRQTGSAFSLLSHNLNYELNPKPPLLPGAASWLRQLKWRWRDGYRLRLELARKCAGLIVSNKLSEAYARTLDFDGPILAMPWGIPQDVPRLQSSPQIRLMLPGQVDPRRRDLTSVLRLLERVPHPQRLELHVVGSINSKRGAAFIADLEQICSRRSIHYTIHGRVAADRFAALMREADVLWLPYAKESRYLFVQERGGVSKVSGIIHDAIRARKYVLLDARYAIDPGWPSFCIRYDAAGALAELDQLLKTSPELSAFGLQQHHRAWQRYLDSLGVPLDWGKR